MKKIIAMAALAAVSATASASTNLFADGSFEEISQVGSGTWAIVSQSTLTGDEGGHGWKVGAAPGVKGAASGLEVRDGVAGAAQDGVNFIELDGNENDMITQTLKTVVNQQYEISFYVEDRPDVANLTGGYGYKIVSGAMNVSSTSVGSFGTNWIKQTIDFTALASSTKFSIWAAGKSDSLGTSFDNFSATAVPEPATLGLLAAGLAVLGLTSRRRRQQ
jgi:hypothetical protein